MSERHGMGGDPDEALRLAERVVAAAERAGAGEAEAMVYATESALTRFANSEIHQNVSSAELFVNLRLVRDQRVGVASTGRDDDEGIRALAARAASITDNVEPLEDWAGLPEADRAAPISGAWAEGTAQATPELRSDGARAVIAASDAAGVTAYGSFSTEASAVAVASSRGTRNAERRTSARLIAVTMGPDNGTGYEPGDYPVVLNHYAVTDLLDYLSYLGFSALAAQEGRSFYEPGRRVGSPLVTVVDDGRDPAGVPEGFDAEGVPKQRLTLIEAGICRDLAYDAQTAAKAGRQSTGHGLPAPNPWGPLPTNLVMTPGETSFDELLGGLDRGLLVTRFHYTNPVYPKRMVITGMTRDGTFLVEGGRIVGPVRNLRFTMSYLDAMANVEAISRERRCLRGELGWFVTPALRLSSFAFTGATRAG